MELDIAVEGPWPAATNWEELAERAVEAVSGVVLPLANPRLCASLVFADDAQLHELNREWRGKDKPTNVLSFPMVDPDELDQLDTDGPPVLLGDIALSFETCAREAGEKSVTLEDHATHLVVHGMLHLAGYDHELGEDEAREMEALEIKTLAGMGIMDPYGDQD